MVDVNIVASFFIFVQTTLIWILLLLHIFHGSLSFFFFLTFFPPCNGDVKGGCLWNPKYVVKNFPL